ncbi:uncharacterized protein BXZ73DRAFT_81640 [Epithele typhae]|uniref:uncharacterized protein n=1 Tax=Epithele typhae TaxID=378194 RepID=UPI00200870F7|nr:uncharacterized protein BXZ73DRAFT_81640 [Epithele typhae]KAH9914497.1 hypothetical protein BXZ73DRAFT_81640 [Epithele typhae]
MITDSPQLPLLGRPSTKDNDAYQVGVTLPEADREDLRKLNTKAEVRTWTLLKAEEHERLMLVYRSMHNATVLCGTLPTELLSLIFVFATATTWLGTRSRVALRLLCVCRRWREVALGCSEIWANTLDTGTFHMGEIGVNNADTDDEGEDGFGNEEDDEKQATWEEKNGRRQEYEYFLFALKLSASRQLALHISSFPQHFLSVTLPEHTSRISRMTIKITSEDVFEQLYQILKSGMPLSATR